MSAEIKIVTGMSGAGKSEAMQVLEDLDYYCVDNLPPNLFSKFIEVSIQAKIEKIAIAADIRGRKFFSEFYDELVSLHEQYDLTVIFIEASDDVLVRRYKETRRRHPMGEASGVLGGIRHERKLLESVRGMADIVIDTSNMKIKELREQLLTTLDMSDLSKMSVTFSSFGFKYGLPMDADLVMDVRFLPNPFYVDELRLQTGLDDGVRDYVMSYEVTLNFIRRYGKLIRDLLPLYRAEGKKHISVAIGCTGGQHRSVVIADELARRLRRYAGKQYTVTSAHRDISRANK